MSEKTTKKSQNQRMGLMIGGLAVLLIVIAYFAFYYPPLSTEQLSGTIGGVETAKDRLGQVLYSEPPLPQQCALDVMERLGLETPRRIREGRSLAGKGFWNRFSLPGLILTGWLLPISWNMCGDI